MDTWNVARLILDGMFGLCVAGLIGGFLYRREKNIRRTVADAFASQANLISGTGAVREDIVPSMVNGAISRRELPTQVPTAAPRRPQPAAARLSRAEKYLEAVRQYREGCTLQEIEKNIGISFMELELLGKAR